MISWANSEEILATAEREREKVLIDFLKRNIASVAV